MERKVTSILPISWVSKRWIASTGVTLDVRKAVGKFYPSQFQEVVA